MAAPLLEVRGLGKSFPGVVALAGVDFTLHGGEVVALIGENGAGKSTLMKVFAGLHRPDAGELLLDGAPVELDGPADALRRGIALIHQELNLAENLTVAGALFLGAELRRGPFLAEREMAERARDVLARLGLDVPPNRLVESLGPGQKQLLEIGRALRANARVIIMDEPTSSLTGVETERLMAVVDELRSQGVGIVYISHRLAEVQRIADRVVALRDGRNSGECSGAEASHDRMVAMMVGREFDATARTPHPPGELALCVRGLRTAAFPDVAVDFDVRAGEIVGIAGLLGAGRSELLRALFGADRALAGTIEVAGRRLAGHEPSAAAAAGLALAPEDRKSQGLVLSMTVAENLSLPTLRRRGRFVDRGYEQRLCAESIANLGIAATAGGGQVVGTLSGGNQQKIVLGKWLASEPRVLLLDEPTRGVDVRARAEIHARLHELAGKGLAVLFVSSEMEEVLTLADRVLVMHQGRIAGELAQSELGEEAVMRLAVGVA
ncbi:MAG: sugar ABC transporter ATP-binding protein [Planctomycetes bacterium]|nr:sugar ABC transporter ATP-binding protein [Planctomycetota bacterium]